MSKEDFELVKKHILKILKTLDKAITVETDDFLNKVRDLYLGSAPTDILTILGSLATLGYHLGKSDNNEQRVSISFEIRYSGTQRCCNFIVLLMRSYLLVQKLYYAVQLQCLWLTELVPGLIICFKNTMKRNVLLNHNIRYKILKIV